MVIFLQKKTPYKSKYHVISFLQILQTKIFSSSDYINQKKRSGAKQTELFRMFFTLHKQ